MFLPFLNKQIKKNNKISDKYFSFLKKFIKKTQKSDIIKKKKRTHSSHIHEFMDVYDSDRTYPFYFIFILKQKFCSKNLRVSFKPHFFQIHTFPYFFVFQHHYDDDYLQNNIKYV